MNLHKHARLSPRGRALLVDRILVQKPCFGHFATTVPWACASSACSPTTAPAIARAPSADCSIALACAICAPGPTPRGPTARPSVWSKLACAMGLCAELRHFRATRPRPRTMAASLQLAQPHASLGYLPPITKIPLNNVLDTQLEDGRTTDTALVIECDRNPDVATGLNKAGHTFIQCMPRVQVAGLLVLAESVIVRCH